MVKRIAKALHVTPEYLLDMEKKKEEDPYSAITTTITRYGKQLSCEEKIKVIELLVKSND